MLGKKCQVGSKSCFFSLPCYFYFYFHYFILLLSFNMFLFFIVGNLLNSNKFKFKFNFDAKYNFTQNLNSQDIFNIFWLHLPLLRQWFKSFTIICNPASVFLNIVVNLTLSMNDSKCFNSFLILYQDH